MNVTARRQARALERKRIELLAQQRKKRIRLLVIVVAVVLALVVLVVVLFNVVSKSIEAGVSESTTRSVAETTTQVAAASEEIEVGNKQYLQPFGGLYFFEHERGHRYVNYQAAHPEMLPEQVVVEVNVDLDIPQYESTNPVADPNDLLALVTKHFYLPYEYEPSNLITHGNVIIREELIDPIERLVNDAANDGVYLVLGSGYRSAAAQEALYNGYVASLGIEWAELQGARPQYSEHQTGLVIDFSPTDINFYDTAEAYWIQENAYKYGFIVRYTEENSDVTLYIHEPWHVRYVGEDVARFMHDNGIGSLEEYWVKYLKHSPNQSQ